MNIYEIKIEWCGGSRYAWVSGFAPITDNINDIPFLKDAPDAIKKMKVDFWKVNPRPPGLKFETQGSEGQAKIWPDLLGCGGGPPHAFFSEKILSDLKESGIHYLRATEMPHNLPFPKKLRGTTPPNYYVLEAVRGIAHAYDAMGVQLDFNGRPLYDRSKSLPKQICRMSSWNGSDLFSYTDTIWALSIMCTEKVVKLAEAKKWTNIKFTPLATAD